MEVKMRFMRKMLRNYPLSVVLFLVIWYLSFFTPPHTELDNVKFIDKWVHVLMYGGTCSVLWLEHVLRNGHKAIGARAVALGWLAPVAMSGLIELLQAYCTGGWRSGDWLDLAANACGVTLALAFGWAVARLRPKGRRGAR